MRSLLCHDCGKNIVSGEKYMAYEVSHDRYAKCEICYGADPILRNFRETEVYSRVVGYIRPTKQWNKGKQAEYADRKEFVVSACGC